jgi:hypothetical protein
MFYESHRYIVTQFQWGEGTTTSPTNRHPIPFTIKVRVILVSGGKNGQRMQRIKRIHRAQILTGQLKKGVYLVAQVPCVPDK